MYTHIVKRDSGYVAGWFRSEQEAELSAVECNREVPGDPAHTEVLDDAAWDEFVSWFPAGSGWPDAAATMRHIRRNVTI